MVRLTDSVRAQLADRDTPALLAPADDGSCNAAQQLPF
jgi:hypothetical protein